MQLIPRWLYAKILPGDRGFQYEALTLADTEPRDDNILPETESHLQSSSRQFEEKQLVDPRKSFSNSTSFFETFRSLTKIATAQQALTIVLHGIFSVFKYLILYIIPSFISNRTATDSINPARNKKIPPTAYLNGLRGFAAYIVFCQHFMTYFYGNTPLWGFHAHPETDKHFFQLPFIRIIHSGRFCVTIFYLLSGYVLGYKPLQHIRQGDTEGLGNNLGSAIFRRGLRLFLPLIPPLFIAGVCVYMGIYGTPKHPMRGTVVASADGTLFTELTKTFKMFDKIVNPFSHSVYYPKTIPALYTLKVEFRGSIMIFTVLFGLSKARAQMRMGIAFLIACYSLGHGRWDAFLFLCGIVLAELRYVRASPTKPMQAYLDRVRFIHLPRPVSVLFWICVCILSLYLGSFPRHGAKTTPGYRTLARITPQVYNSTDDGLASFWCSIAAVLLVSALENMSLLQRPFNTSLARYMGDISFSLYVFHVPIYLTFGRWITVRLIKWTGSYNFGFVGGGAVLTTVLIVVADLQWRVVDINSVKFARWLEVKVFA